MKLREEVEGGSICNLAAAIVEATVEVEVSVLEVFSSSQLTPLSVFIGCQSSVCASLQWVPVFSGCQFLTSKSEYSRLLSKSRLLSRCDAAVEVSRPPSRCSRLRSRCDAAIEVSRPLSRC
jgi:hypothetical protein